MIIQPHEAPFGLVLTRLGSMLAAASGALSLPYRSPPPDDPVFLPDFATLMPGQVQELRYGKGRDR